MNQHLTIEPLGQHPDLVPLTVDWHVREFDPEGDVDFWLRARREEARLEGVPCAWIAFVDGDPVGSVSLIAHNMDTHQELTPWLAAIFVLPAFRRRAIGEALARRCQEEAWALGFDRLYLYSDRNEAIAWYTIRGWTPLFEELYEGHPTLVMVHERPSSMVQPGPALTDPETEGSPMKLVDLNGRQDEPTVRRVLERSHGSAAALDEALAHYRSSEWMFIGWQEAEAILACAGAERLDGDTIGIRSIAVEPAWRRRGLGRSLLDALAGRLEATKVVAETDDDAVGFYRGCGFAVEEAPPKFGRPRFWCVLEIRKPF